MTLRDLTRFGTNGELVGRWWNYRQAPPNIRGAGATARCCFINGLGDVEKDLPYAVGIFTAEQIAELPSRDEVRACHMEPAYEQAKANHKDWLAFRDRHPAVEVGSPELPDPATSRFLGDD